MDEDSMRIERWIRKLMELADRAVDNDAKPQLAISGYPDAGFCVRITEHLYGRGTTLVEALAECSLRLADAVNTRVSGDRAALREFKPVLEEMVARVEQLDQGRQLTLPLDHVVHGS